MSSPYKKVINAAGAMPTVLIALALFAAGGDARAEGYMIRGATLIDGTGGSPVENSTVIVRDGRIEFAGESVPAGYSKQKDLQVIDAGGKYLVPGLVDSHSHVDHANGLNLSPQQKAVARLYNPVAFLYNGVTTVINMSASEPDWVLALREAGNSGDRYVPRVFAGEHFTVPGGWGSRHGGAVQTDEDIRRRLDHLVAEDYDLTKILYEDGLAETPAFPRMSRQTLLTISDGSRKRGLPVFIHAIDEEEYRDALAASPRSIVHGLSDRPDDIDALVNKVKESGTYVTPTLVLFEAFTRFLDNPDLLEDPVLRASVPPFVLRSVKEKASLERAFARMDEIIKTDTRQWSRSALRRLAANTRDFAEAGVPLVIGSDAGGAVVHAFQGYSTPRELELLVDCCLTPMQGLVAATRVAAEMMGREDEFGTIQAGRAADILILNADPLEDISRVRDFDHLFVRGNYITRDALSYEEYRKNLAGIAEIGSQ